MSKTLQEILEDEYPSDVKVMEIRVLLLDKLSRAIGKADDLPSMIDQFNKELKTL